VSEIFHIGVDSTDSATLGMCTTYLGARLLEELGALGIEVCRAPELVRLNPNVPWKTRGNGAIHICLRATLQKAGEAFEAAQQLVDQLAVLQDPQTNPGLVMLQGEVPEVLNRLYRAALHRIVRLEEALEAARTCGARVKGWKNQRGIIGALASLGVDFAQGYTWEVIAYRRPERYGKERQVDPESVREASERHRSTFFNIDEDGRLLCVPHSPCPVLYGIRGTAPLDTLACAAELRTEPIERWVLWRTNQHTDAHIEFKESLEGVQPYSSISVRGKVASQPEYDRGGHLYFTLEDSEGRSIRCAAYRQTLTFRQALFQLVPGDRIRIWGAVRPASNSHPQVINLEKVKVESCVRVYREENPTCPRCGGRMESLGAGKGQRCKKCRFRVRVARKERKPVERLLGPGFIEPHPEAWRHLYKPCNLPEVEEPPYSGAFWGLGPPALPK